MKVFKISLVSIFIMFLAGCGSLPNTSDIQNDGYFYNAKNSKTVTNCRTTTSIDYDLDKNKQILLVDSNYMVGTNYIKSKATKINYFENVFTIEDLETQIIKDNKQDDVGSISGDLGYDIKRISKNYRNFLYLLFNYNYKSRTIELKLIEAATSSEIFVASIPYHYSTFNPVYEDDIPNPLFNELIKYIEKNSKTYTKPFPVQPK